MLLFRLLLSLPSSIAKAIIIYLPGEAGILLRRRYYGRRLKRCGKVLIVLPGVHIDDPACIEIGNNVMIRENAIIRSSVPQDDDARDCRWVGPKDRGKETGIVKIGDHSRIAFNALLLGYGGIQIGEKCGIGPGSIILSETYHYKGSVPGRVYKYSQGASPEELKNARLIHGYDFLGWMVGAHLQPCPVSASASTTVVPTRCRRRCPAWCRECSGRSRRTRRPLRSSLGDTWTRPLAGW